MANGFGGPTVSFAGMLLKPWDERTLSSNEMIPIIQKQLDQQPGLQSFAFNPPSRSEEHTSELQSQKDLVCRLLLEKKNAKSLFSPTSPLLHPCLLTTLLWCSRSCPLITAYPAVVFCLARTLISYTSMR